MKVLYILDRGTVGGATKAVIDLVCEMKGLGVTPIIVTSLYNDLNRTFEHWGMQTVSAGHYTAIQPINTAIINGRFKYLKVSYLFLRAFLNYYFGEICAIIKVSKAVNFKDVNLIHTNSARNTLGCFLSLIYRKPHVTHLREFGDKDFGCIRLNPFYYSIQNNLSTRLISVSNAVYSHWTKKGIDSKKIVCIYDGINNSDIAQAREERMYESQVKCVIAGGVCEAKGQHLAVEALGLLPREIRKTIHLDLIGWFDRLYVGKIIDIAQKYNISHNISFCGSHSNVHDELKDYQIGLMCSRAEGFGLVTAEYMHAGLGVIASDSGACPELIDNERTGLLFKSGDSHDLARCIERLYNDRELLVMLSQNARKEALQRFTAEINAQNIYKVYQEILNK